MDDPGSKLPIKIDEEDTKTLGNLTGLEHLEDCDEVIRSNGFTQVFGALALIIVYFICRNKTPWVYYPNIKNKPQHPCYQHNPGIFSWIGPLITTKDTQLLSMIGLDGFMFLQMIKLLYRICFFLSLIVVPFLCRWFYTIRGPKRDPQLFILLSLSDIKDIKVYWCILGLAHVITAVVLYLVFIYYKRFVTLRQLYLAAPATMTSISQMKKMSMDLGDDQNAIDFINISSRTVIVDRLPPDIKNDLELLKYMESLKIGDIESVSLIHNTYRLQKMYEERDAVIQDIEKEIATASIKMKKYFKTEKDRCRDSFRELYTEDLERSTLALFENMTFTLEEKVKIFNNFCRYADKFFSKTFIGKSIITLHLARLNEINGKILQEKNRLENTSKEREIEVPKANETLYVDMDVKNDVSFFSMSQILNFRKNSDLFSLELPINRRKGFVTFKDQRTAGIVRQTKLGTRVFSSNTEPAPAPHDVLWRNICREEVGGYFLKLLSLGLYVLFNLFFLVIVVWIVKSLEIEKNTKNFLFKFILKNAFIHSLYRGILAPLIYNILLFFVPIIIKALLHMEQNSSYSGLQVKLMYRLSLFLFFNAFLAMIILTSVLSFIEKIRTEAVTVESLVSEFGSSIARTSVFFFNTVVQRLCIGSAIVILKPSPFLYNWIVAPLAIYTRRQEQEREFSPSIDFGNHIPNILLILPMALVYSCVCPLMLVVSWAFYLFSYLVYRNELLYATRNDYESGGSHWKQCVKFILFSLLAFQIITAILIFSVGMYTVFYSFLPLIFLTFVFSEGLNMVFENSCENFPMNAPEEKFLDRFSKKALEERHKILSEWKEIGEEEDEDILPISELGFEDKTFELTKSYYKDPSTAMSIGNIILPRNFYKVAHFLRSFDKNNLFGLKK